MRKLIVYLHTGHCGMDAYEAVQVAEDTTDEELSNMVWEMALDHASSYGIELCDCDDPECEMEHDNHSIEGSWEDYDPEKHDGMCAGGCSFEKDFE